MSTPRFAPRLPTSAVEIDPEVLPYWEAAAEGRLVIPRCDRCQTHFWYPRGFCPHCGGTDLTWPTASGTGTIYSYTVVRQAYGVWADHVPFVVAYVTLTEGVTVPTNVIGCSEDDLAIGLEVRAVFEKAAPDDQPTLRFKPRFQQRRS